jgi:phospholipid/cholesterol/gamma-HCH transport system permease protein
MNAIFDNQLIKSFLLEIESFLFAGRFSESLSDVPFEFKEILRQCFHGNRLAVSCCYWIYYRFVFTLQSRPTEFGAVLGCPHGKYFNNREIGPIITALICRTYWFRYWC